MGNYENVTFHRMLINDRERSLAYRKAIFETVGKDDVVLDIGTGSGLLALFACQAGAKHVYAVERTGIISLAERMAKENGFGDRITFINKDVRQMNLPEQVDVIVSELISKAVIGQHMEELTAICRDRFLKPGGRLVPRDVELRVAPVELPEQHRKLEFPSPDEYDLDFSSARQLAQNNTLSLKAKIKKLAEPQTAYRIDTDKVQPTDNLNAHLIFPVTATGTVHGYCVWFTTTLSESVSLSTHPPGMQSWDNLIFPLQESLSVKPQMNIELGFRANHPNAANPIWRWNTTITSPSDSDGLPSVVAQFHQSTFAGATLSKDELVRRSFQDRPQLSRQGEILVTLLNELNEGDFSIAKLAENLIKKFPGHWRSRKEMESELRVMLLELRNNNYIGD